MCKQCERSTKKEYGSDKRCAGCCKTLPLKNFSKDGYWLNSNCRQCNRNVVLAQRFGMTIYDYEELWTSQGEACAICCKLPSQEKSKFGIDHDHSTGQVRGILCMRCNIGLGLVGDCPEVINKMPDYLTCNLNIDPEPKKRGGVKAVPIPEKGINLRKVYNLRGAFNISPEMYLSILELQQNKCAICLELFGNKICVDHDHGTSKIRGLLCGPCNSALGLFGESIEILQKTINYIKNPPNSNPKFKSFRHLSRH